MRNERDILLQAVERRLLPFFRRNGFEQSNNRSYDEGILDASFPLGDMRRRKGLDVEVIEIQFDKDGKAKFALNFGVIPEGGIKLPWKNISQECAQICDAPVYYRLYPRHGSMVWFPGLKFEWLRNAELVAERAIDKVIALYSEVEDWFSVGQVGRHVQRTGYPLNLPSSHPRAESKI
jgi:hypothetical protein